MIIIYTRELCPNCDEVKEVLKSKGILFKEENVDYFKNKAKLVVRGLSELPVINTNNTWLQFESMEVVLEKLGLNND